MIFAAQGAEARLLGVAGCRTGLGLEVSRLLHHQKPPPSNATRITPTITTLLAQRIAILAITKKITNNTAPAMMKVVVEVI
jgi:hypothetical protein